MTTMMIVMMKSTSTAPQTLNTLEALEAARAVGAVT
jgi:hypothetical protein